MASWCAICRRKLPANYRYYRGKKVHKQCLEARKYLEALENWVKTGKGDL